MFIGPDIACFPGGIQMAQQDQSQASWRAAPFIEAHRVRVLIYVGRYASLSFSGNELRKNRSIGSSVNVLLINLATGST